MDRDQLAEACRHLPLFPLPQIVLMPGAALPLHVFEPRYRQLVADALAGEGLLAVPQIVPGEELRHPDHPEVYPFTAVGRITAHHQLDDGRYNIVVQPIGRVRIAGEIDAQKPYRVAEAVLLDDRPHVPREVDRIGERVRAWFVPLVAASGERGRHVARVLSGLEASRVPETVAPWVVTDAEARQAYLAQDDALVRAQLVESAVLTLLGESRQLAAAEA